MVAAVLAAPILTVPLRALGPAGDAWSHITSTLLPQYLANTAVLALISGGLALALGFGCAWLVAMCEFPGRRFFRWALVLPLAVPAYMAAYTYAGIVGVTGPLQQLLRAVVPGASDTFFYWNIMRLEVVAVIFGLVLYPYVFLPTRALLERWAGPTLEAARLLGHSHASVFLRVALPFARPAVVGGLALVMMEILSDYGAVQYYGVTTFTTGIFRAWFSLGDLDSAIRLSAILMLVVFAVLGLERWQRGKARFHNAGQPGGVAPYPLSRGAGFAAMAFCSLPLLFGFGVPVAQLTIWAARTAPEVVDSRFVGMALNSFGLAVAAGLLAVVVSVVLTYAARLDRTRLTRSVSKLALLGYSVPGAVIAVGVLSSAIGIDRGLQTASLFLTGSLAVLVFAYVVRFLAVAYLPLEAGFTRIGANLDAASRTLGAGPSRTLLRVELPLLRGAVLAASTLVVMDVLKELPLTLILRPFNFNTLATRAFQLASDEQVAQSAPAALLVIIAASFVVVGLHRVMAGRATR